MLNDSFLRRTKTKARGNQLCIAMGSRFSGELSLPTLAYAISTQFGLEFSVEHELHWFTKWNEFIDAAEKAVGRQALVEFVRGKVEKAALDRNHRRIATIPISNFIDVSLDRRLISALKEGGKDPIRHEFISGFMGSWRQSNPDKPNVFAAFIPLSKAGSFYGLHHRISIHPQDRIQLENMMEMVRQKDLLLLGMSPWEAEHVLHLPALAQAADKIINTEDPSNDYQYWTKRGTYLAGIPTESVIDDLVPHDLQSYTFWDAPFPNRMLIDVARPKQFDVFVSYFSGDKDFARRIHGDLTNRGLMTWRDEGEIAIGDSISDKIQTALTDCYAFVIILSPQALGRPWVKEELRAAYNLRLAEELRILPAVYKDCKLPPFLMDYRYADFREEKNYTEQMELLARSISNAVARARGKK